VILLIVCGAGGAFLYLARQLITNTKITEAIAARIEDKTKDGNIEKMSTTLDTIRADQIESNIARREMNKSIERLGSQLACAEFDILSLAREVSRMKAFTKDPT
jgi:nitric oxide synthase oxygenase domain/subunit